MIRTLTLLSALVAAALAVIFDDPLLYGAAGVFLLVFLFVIVSGLRRRRRADRIRPSLPSTERAGDELQDLGILEIRPKDTASARQEPAAAETGATAGAEPAKPSLPGAIPEETLAATTPTRSIVRIKTAPPRQDPDEVTPEQESRAALTHLLHALLHASGAHTVCLLREEEGASRRYRIEHIVSRNAYARTEGSFVARVPFAEGPEPELHVLGGDLKLEALRYYREELEALRRMLAVTLTRGGDRYVLVADSMEEDTLATPRARFMLASTARMIEQVATDASAPVPVAPLAPPAADGPTPADAPRPRREIIAEEMAAAPNRQLALALVHQQFDEGDDLATCESALEAAIRETTDARVERFGDLTFGVFLHAPIESVEEWVGRAHAHLNGADADPVSIGVAYLADRHDAPDALRADATDALRESYESGQPVLVG